MSNWSTARRREWTPERIAAISSAAVAIIAGGILLGMFASAAKMYYILLVVAVVLLFGLVAWQFEAALVVYALVAFIPWGRTPDLATGGSGEGKGVFISEMILALLLAAWAVRYLSRALPRDRIKSGFYTPIALYLAYSVLCVVCSFIFWDQHVDKIHQYPMVNMIELALRFMSAFAFVMMATTISNRKWLGVMTIAIMIPGFYSLANGLSGGRIPFGSPWWSLLTLLPACYVWCIAMDSGYTRTKRIAAAVFVVTTVFVVLVRNLGWVSGWLGLCTALATVTYIRSRKTFVAMALVALVATAMCWPYLHKNVVETSKTEGDFDRFSLMAGAWKYATTFPLGVGPGNYRSYNSFYYGEKWGTTNYTSAHGTYSQLLSEMGIPGALLFLSILVCGFLWMLRNYRRLPRGPSKAFLLAATGQLVGISISAIIGDYIIPSYHNGGLMTFSTTVYSWLIWGLAVAHVRISEMEEHGSVDINSQLEHARPA